MSAYLLNELGLARSADRRSASSAIIAELVEAAVPELQAELAALRGEGR